MLKAQQFYAFIQYPWTKNSGTWKLWEEGQLMGSNVWKHLDLNHIGKKWLEKVGGYIISTRDHLHKRWLLWGKAWWAGSSKGDLLNNAIQYRVGKGVKKTWIRRDFFYGWSLKIKKIHRFIKIPRETRLKQKFIDPNACWVLTFP